MARGRGGGGIADYVLIDGEATVIGGTSGRRVALVGGATVRFYTARTGGTQYGDLIDETGVPASQIVTADGTDATYAYGQIPEFQFPDGVSGAWASANDGPRSWVAARFEAGAASELSGFKRFRVAPASASAEEKAACEFVCDGVADEVQIQAALDALPDTGGLVQLLAGDYFMLAPPVINTEAVTLAGVGAGQAVGAAQQAAGTRLRAVTGFVGSQILRVQRTANDRTLYGVHLRDFAVDGAFVGSGLDGILFRGDAGQIEHVHVHRVSGAGIRLSGYPTWPTADTVLDRVQVTACTVAGVYVDTDATDVRLSNSTLRANADNLVVRAGGFRAVGNHLYAATRYNTWVGGGGSRARLAENTFENSGDHNVNVDSTLGALDDVQLLGNAFTSTNFAANNASDHLIVQGPTANPVTRLLASGNTFTVRTGATRLPRYGVNFSSAVAVSGAAVGNVFGPAGHFGTGPLRNSGLASNPPTARGNVGVTQDLEAIDFDYPGALASGTGTARWYNRTGVVLVVAGAWISVGTASTVGAIVADVRRNGTSIYGTPANRPTIAATSNGGDLSGAPTAGTVLNPGDYVTIDIVSAGTGAANLVGAVMVSRGG